jgi:hypothetical protein
MVLALAALHGCTGRDTPPAAVDTMRVETREEPTAFARDTATMSPGDSMPTFSAYPARERYSGRPAAVQLASAGYGRAFRTKLREGAARGPNFAGAYTIVLWGCGSGCQIVAVVDARSGRLSRQTLHTMNGIDYRTDSRLLIADPIDPTNPPPPGCASCGTPAAYEWDGKRFQPVGPGPHPHLEGDRPW